jgi:4-amino-4-deoxy-L-arabinose transferase-like glycosyltransferase
MDVSPRARPSAGFVGILASLTVLGIALRCVYAVAVGRHLRLGLDSIWYQLVGKQLAGGYGYVDPSTLLSTGRRVATANFPPLYPAVVALERLVGLTTPFRQQLAGAVIGGATVVLTGLVGYRVGGRAVGLVAALLIAVWPPLIAADGSLMSEGIAVPLTMLAVLLALHATARRSFRWWVAVGVCLGLVALVRSEGTLYAVLLLAGCIILGDRGEIRRRAYGAGVALAVCALFVLPWSINRASEVGRQTLPSTNAAKTLAGANCPEAYSGPGLGGWQFSCLARATEGAGTENALAARARHAGADYATSHLSRLPTVVVVRELRSFGVWSPARLDRVETEESRNARWQRLGWWCTILVLPAAGVGCVLLARRRPLVLAPLAAVVVATAVSYGNQRLRLVADPVLLLGVAIVGVNVWCRLTLPRPAVPQELAPPAPSAVDPIDGS